MAHSRKFRFGISAKVAQSGSDFRELARKTEDLGYSTFFMPDHFVDHALAPIPGIAVAAAVTTTLRVGTFVLGNDYRHPVVLASEAATIDLLSDGRLELGMGAGWMTVDYERAGMDLEAASVRIARLDEALTVMKGLMADGPFTFSGDHYNVTALEGEPKPVQRPHPPILIGGGGPKILAVAAKHAQIVGVNANLRSGDSNNQETALSLTAAATDAKLEHLRKAAADNFDNLEIQTLTGFVHITEDRTEIAAGIASHFQVATEVALESPAVLVGTVDQICEDLLERRERWQMSYVVIPEEFIDTLAPVVARLGGT
ncbi:MAG: TIGR03621 family F420-dependent LLM class oxidoreductase [Acidimicrobiia bacterium]|nr:TIGR03621 family F420-dependent LLM class oxidoreductase [Acidimicrobiia bacterium]